MATRIRLQRHGKKGKPFFHIVAADSRSKRDGRFIEKLGTYDPTKNPAVINLKFENTLSWVQKGAELTDTARAILSYKGVLYKNHLLKGVVKGALTEADVEKKFEAWLKEKEAKIQAKIDGLNKSAAKAKSDKLKSESAAKEARAAAIIEKNTPAPEEAPVEAAAEEAPAEAATEEAPVEAATEEAPAEAATEEAPAEAATEEAPAEAATEEAPAEAATEEAPAEAATEEAPAEAATEEAPAEAEEEAEEAPAEATEEAPAEAATEEAPAEETSEDSDKKEAPSAE